MNGATCTLQLCFEIDNGLSGLFGNAASNNLAFSNTKLPRDNYPVACPNNWRVWPQRFAGDFFAAFLVAFLAVFFTVFFAVFFTGFFFFEVAMDTIVDGDSRPPSTGHTMDS